MAFPTTATITVSEPAELGKPLTVHATWPDGRLKNPRVEVFAYQDLDGDGQVTKDIFGPDVAYGEAGPYPGQDATVKGNEVTVTFAPLGGGASYWLTNGGPAQCVARLFYFKIEGTDREWNGNGQQEVVYLAATEFDAAG